MCAIAAATVAFLMIPVTAYATLVAYGDNTEDQMLLLSHGISILLLMLYAAYMAFRLQSRADFLDERVYLGERFRSSRFGPVPSAIMLIITIIWIVLCGTYLIHSVDYIVDKTQVSSAFFGVILIPMITSSSELAPAVFFTYEDTMNLAINVVVGTAMQIALFVMPFMVILGWIIGKDMTLHFEAFDSIMLFLGIVIVNYQVQDGKSTYVASAICLVTYVTKLIVSRCKAR